MFACLVALCGCSPDDITGATLVDGRVGLTNCGLWIEGVQAFDADSGTLLWSAQAGPPDGERRTVSSLTIGTVPIANGWGDLVRWEEIQPMRAGPAPDRWRFEVDTGLVEPTVLEVASADLAPDSVVLAGGRTVSTERFVRTTCSTFASMTEDISPPIAIGLLAGFVGVSIWVVLLAFRALRR